MKTIVTLIAIVLVGCSSPAPTAPKASPSAPAATPAAAKPPATPPQVIGYSVHRRPIELYTFGQGERPVLILGAIHGDEPTSAAVANDLIDLLRQYPQTPANVPIAIVPIANPDGYAARTRTNTRQIDLNRNFPAKNFAVRSQERYRRSYGGQSPLSEPESQALDALITRLNPRLLISIHSMEKPCNNYDGPNGKSAADLMLRYNRYPSIASIGYPTPGSLGSYAGIDKQIPMVTLELPRRASGEVAWKDNKDAIVAAIIATK